MICTCIQDMDLNRIEEVLGGGTIEMAEIRLDRCPLTEKEIERLFSGTDIPLVATCRIKACSGEQEVMRKLTAAATSGAAFVDLELDASPYLSRHIRKLCASSGVRLIRSWHDFDATPDKGLLLQLRERCFRYGADIAKIVVTCRSEADADVIMSLYDEPLSTGEKPDPASILAFGMGGDYTFTRLASLKKGAPFMYASLSAESPTAPGQMPLSRAYEAVYGKGSGSRRFDASQLRMPVSKSLAQRAIIAASLACGTSHLSGYTPCSDSESAIGVAERLGAVVKRTPEGLEITGTGPVKEKLDIEELNVGESGLLARLMIPLAAQTMSTPVVITGEKTLLRRPLNDAADIMASFGVILHGNGAVKTAIPVKVCGNLIPGTADVSAKSGSQLISGLLMALPLASRMSTVYVSEPKSIPYMFMTLEMLRAFGIQVESEMEGEEELVQYQDWSFCNEITFRIPGGQQYKAADVALEADWSSAAPFLVAGALFGRAQIVNLAPDSLQADLTILDILVEAGASVSQSEESGEVCVCKAPLCPFEVNLENAPDLFPVTAVLAAFCPGESRLTGVHRLAGKESDRCLAISGMLEGMGVPVRMDGNDMVIEGESYSSRLASGRLLKGGEFRTCDDHRMLMAMMVASLGASSPVVPDNTSCAVKSFPGFNETFINCIR